MVPRETVPKGVRQAQEPLADRHPREDTVHQMGDALGHAPEGAAAIIESMHERDAVSGAGGC